MNAEHEMDTADGLGGDPLATPVNGDELREGDLLYVEGEWLPLEALSRYDDLTAFTAFSGSRELFLAVDGRYSVKRP